VPPCTNVSMFALSRVLLFHSPQTLLPTRVIAHRRARMIGGLSAGGFGEFARCSIFTPLAPCAHECLCPNAGAVRFCMLYPELWISAAALSPAVYAP
jgi:hypothetical protein